MTAPTASESSDGGHKERGLGHAGVRGGVVDRDLKQADDPCRVIEIVARAGQLYATLWETPYCDRTRYSKSANAVQLTSNLADSVPLASSTCRTMTLAGDRGLACKSCGRRPCQTRSLLAQELAGQIVDEVQSVAGGANHRSVRAHPARRAANAARSFRFADICK